MSSPGRSGRSGLAGRPLTATFPALHAFCASERVLKRHATSSHTSRRTPSRSSEPSLVASRLTVYYHRVPDKPFLRTLSGQVLVATAAGVAVGYVHPGAGAAMKPLGDAFIALVRMVIAPVIFCTVVVGVASVGDMKAVGRTGGLALVYFEILST
jgi:hypothetical protein